MSQTPILDLLEAALNQDHAAFYMPGHKRGRAICDRFRALLGSNLFYLDLPELPGIDQAIAEAEILAARAYQAEQTWFLVNGSTVGVQAALLAICQPGDQVLIGRNAHKAAIAGLVLTGCLPIYLPTEIDPKSQIDLGVSPEHLEAALRLNHQIKAIILVSPNYFGVVGEIVELVAIAHRFGVPVIVDGAHGAHLAFHPDLPTDAIAAGADLVIHSTHKMATSLTQSSMLHLQGERVDSDRVSQALDLLQSSSPSLILLASLDASRQQMVSEGKKMLSDCLELAQMGRSQLQKIADLELVSEIPSLDPTRLTVLVKGIGKTGFALDQIFCDQYKVVAELPGFDYLVFAISVGNQKSDVERLVAAFAQVERSDRYLVSPKYFAPDFAPTISPREAFFAPTETIAFIHSSGRRSQELICPYPPGIPIIFPGAIISPAAIAYLQQVLSSGGVIKGARDQTLQTIAVIKEC